MPSHYVDICLKLGVVMTVIFPIDGGSAVLCRAMCSEMCLVSCHEVPIGVVLFGIVLGVALPGATVLVFI